MITESRRPGAPTEQVPCDLPTHRPLRHRGIHILLLLAVGMLFGATLTQGQAIAWYRIHEMFRFGSFHMYGIIGSALALGILVTRVIRRRGLRDVYGEPIEIAAKGPGWKRFLFGGLVFGLGWGLAGLCPGPMFILLGHGTFSVVIALGSAMLGTFCYGLVRDRLPH